MPNALGSANLFRYLAVLGWAICMSVWLAPMATAQTACQVEWTAWEHYRTRFISDDGRVIDGYTVRKQTVSEAQAYALFFSLVANDRKSFDKVLQWTENNLAAGDLTSRLPAWLWGQKSDGSWGVVDANAASDADLWIIYALGEAGRLWGEPRFTSLASQLAARVLREETADIPGLGLTLLPGPVGFQLSDKTWRLNPSYVPMHLMTWMANQNFDPAWSKIAASSLQLIAESAPRGFAPDWTLYEAGKGFREDDTNGQRGEGGYDAIRVYLWAGMLASDAPYRKSLLNKFSPMAGKVASLGMPPEFIHVRTGETRGQGSVGFSAALLPFLSARGDSKTLKTQLARLSSKPIPVDAYYDQVLALFATGWREQRYAFSDKGSLSTAWVSKCPPPAGVSNNK